MKKVLRVLFVLAFAGCSHYFAVGQNVAVSGQVTSSEDNSPLPGVSVSVKGTTSGTTTNAEGRYTLQAPADAVLVFSFIGMTTQEVPVGGRTTVNVTLAADVAALQEVVVTALGLEAERRSLGTSVTTVKAAQIETVRQTNIVNALAAKVPGVRIQSTSGMVGASSSIFIRGFTSFTQSNQPLFVVDGIPIDNGGGGNQLQSGVSNSNRAIDINPDDVESMNILKGPAAAVLYGSRAVNGAIIITTKKGRRNTKSTVEVVSNYNIVEVNRLPKYQNEYAQGSNGYFSPTTLDSWGPRIQGQTVTNYLGEPEVLRAYPNNVRDIFRQGSNFQNSVQLSGGTDKSTYIASYSNLQESGIIANNRLVRNTFRITATNQFTDKFSGGASFTYFNTTSQRTQQGNQLSNPLFRGYFLPRSYNLRNYPIQDPDGSQSYFDPQVDNPLWTIENNRYNDRVDRILGNINLQYNFTDWLNVNYKIGTDAFIQNFKGTDAIGSRGGGNAGAPLIGGTYDQNLFVQQTNSYLNLQMDRRFGNFGINALVGNEININLSRNQAVTGTGASVSGFDQITSYQTYVPFSEIIRSRLIGVYGQVTADYRQYLYLTLQGRNDWSSTFAPGNRSYFYPAVTTSFVFTEAIPALKNNNRILNFGKIRANIAQVGRQAPAFSTDTYFIQSAPGNGYGPFLQYPFRSNQGYSISDVAGNPNLGPEFTVTREVGTELGFFQNRLSLDVAFFSTKSTDIIVSAPTSVAAGFTNFVRNAGELKSEGWEVGLNATPVKAASGFTWTVNANWTRIRNTVLRIDPLVNTIFLGGFTTPQTQLRAGQPYGIIVGNPLLRDANGNLLITATGTGAGQANFNTTSIEILGNPNPDWTGGLTNTFAYKGFALSFLIDVRRGGDVISRNIRDVRVRGVAEETGDRDRTYVIPGVLRDPTNNEDGTPRALVGADGSPIPNNIAISAQQYWASLYGVQGETMVFDASWIRLREASVSYIAPKSLTDRTPFGRIELTLTGRNLFLYAPNYPHFDPEVNSQGVSNSQGFEYNTLPQTRTYGAMLRFTF
ncbi:MAG: SusC/RagA family TonB-linked outer membrane protein [Cytophagales bacterium]|nr:SusC/RagA family TonB-linked outer membrane protein [Cytophagales bacterium]